MQLNRVTGLWARTALFWFVLTMGFGMYLGLTGQFGASSAHAHLGLLGWLSPIAFAFLWTLADPNAQLARRARIHWTLHNLGMIVQVTGLWMVIRTGDALYGRMIGVGGLIIILATLWLITMLWPRLGGALSASAAMPMQAGEGERPGRGFFAAEGRQDAPAPLYARRGGGRGRGDADDQSFR